MKQDPTNSSGLRGSWPQDRTWCWAAVDSHGQPWTAMDSCGSGLAWLLGTHSGMCRMPPLSSPHLNKYLLSTCCVSVRDQGSGVSSFSPRADPAGVLGVRSFSKRTVCTGPVSTCLGPPVFLGQLAGTTGGSLVCRVLCMEPSSGFLGSQGAPHPICFWASLPSSVLSLLCNPCPLALTLQSLSP